MKYFTDKEIDGAIKRAPKTIQDAMTMREDNAVVVAQIGRGMKLHIDQIGILAELNRNMLLGLISPDEFFKDLIEAKIPEKDAREIMKEINEKIFVPLREEMRKGPAPQAVPVSPKATQGTAREGLLQPLTTIIPANPKMLPRLPQIFAPTPENVPPAKSIEPKAKAPSSPSFPAPNVQLPASRLLEDHEEPHIDISEKVQGASSSVQRKPYNLSLKPVFEPPPNLPGAIYHPPIPKPPVSIPPPASPKPIQPLPPTKPYSSDPYREPIGP